MTKQKVLIIGCGFPQLNLLKFCRIHEIEVVGVDANPNAVGRFYCDEFVNLSTTDVPGILAALKDYDVDGLTTCGSDHAVRSAAEVSKMALLPFYASPDLVDRCQNKPLMREILRDAGVPGPAFVATEDLAQVKQFVAAQGLPIVLKPARGWGQRGVRKVERSGELVAAFTAAQHASRNCGGDKVVLAEEFIDGPEFSVNSFTVNGRTTVLCVTERIISSYPDPPGITFAEIYPSGLNDACLKNVREATKSAISSLGFSNGPAYTQLRYTANGPIIIEAAFRLGGGLDPDITHLASGVSLYQKIVGMALDRKSWISAAPKGDQFGGVVGKFLVASPGRIQAITGLDDAASIAGIVDVEVYPGIGESVSPLVNGSHRAGHVLATGKNRRQAEDRATQAASLIQITTTNDE